MAQSSSLGRSINLGSDQIPEHYCEQCFDENEAIKPVAGYCIDCSSDLCHECYTVHLRPKPFRNHRLVDKSTRPKSKLKSQRKHQDTGEKCPRHHVESLQSFCKTHSQLCCKVCLTITHKNCDTEKISKMAKNIKSSGELQDMNKKLSQLKTGFNENLNKTETNRSTIQKNALEANNEMKKLRDEFERLMTETENQVEQVIAEDLKKVESVSETCNVVIDQINKMTTNLDIIHNKGDSESIFISVKRVENELQSMEESLTKVKLENTVREYKFEPDAKMKSLLSKLKVLGRLSFLPASKIDNSATRVDIISQQMSKKPTHVKNIKVSDKDLCYHSSVVQNKQIVTTDYLNKTVKLIDTNTDITVSEIRLAGNPVSIAKVNTGQFAVTVPYTNKIQMLTLTQNKLSIGNELSVNGECHGITYNDKDQTFIVSFIEPGKVEIINMTGAVVAMIETDSKGSKLFPRHNGVAMCPDMNEVYVSDFVNDSVTLLTLDGDVKAVYKANGLVYPVGICAHKSGVVYVVGQVSQTVHQLDPVSGKFKLLLDQNNGLSRPWSISYCDVDDKIYIGMYNDSHLKVFEMK